MFAEALRIRTPTRDALIRDKLRRATGVRMSAAAVVIRQRHLGLVLTGRLVTTTSEQSLSAALTRLIARSGRPSFARASTSPAHGGAVRNRPHD
jgi:hypothetical protein